VKKAVPAILLALAVFLLYRKVTRLWWTYDDAYNVKVAITHAWTEPFTERILWPQKLFTPLLSATHEILLALFGLDVPKWYAVHLALLVAAALAVLAALRLYVPRPAALASAFLFAAGVPIASVATQIMVIHYLESIVLGALAVVLYVEGVRRHRHWMSITSALLYFGAMLAKEVAVPLPILLLLLPERTFEKRAQHAIGHSLALGGYLLWRLLVLGTIFGGYGWAIAPGELPMLILTLPWKVLTACAGAALVVGLLLLGLVGAGAAGAFANRRAIAISLVTLVLVLGPIVPVSKEMQPRYAVIPWLWMCVLFAAGIGRVPLRNLVILGALFFAAIANRQQWTIEYGRARQMSEEARFYLEMPGDGMLRAPSIPPATMGELQWMKEAHLNRVRGASWFYDDLYLCHGAYGGRRIFEYDLEQRRVIEITARVPDLAHRYCSTIRENAPLRAEFHHRNASLFWNFGPYDEGEWAVVLANGVQAFPVPRRDGFRLGELPGIALRVRYQSPEGWVTYSPEIALDFARQPDLVWHR
jgi:hypothetical protein